MRFLQRVGRNAIIPRRLIRGVRLRIILFRWRSYLQVLRCWFLKRTSLVCTKFVISVRVLAQLLIAPNLSPLEIGSERRHGMSDDPAVSESEIMVAELRIVQSMDSEGQIHVYDMSQSSDGTEIEPSKALELIEWARASILAPMVYGMMQAFGDAEDE